MLGGADWDTCNATEAIDYFSAHGIEATFTVIDCHILGIPQTRKRIFFFGIHVENYKKMMGWDSSITVN